MPRWLIIWSSDKGDAPSALLPRQEGLVLCPRVALMMSVHLPCVVYIPCQHSQAAETGSWFLFSDLVTPLRAWAWKPHSPLKSRDFTEKQKETWMEKEEQ